MTPSIGYAGQLTLASRDLLELTAWIIKTWQPAYLYVMDSRALFWLQAILILFPDSEDTLIRYPLDDCVDRSTHADVTIYYVACPGLRLSTWSRLGALDSCAMKFPSCMHAATGIPPGT
jgi:hypothetical protein